MESFISFLERRLVEQTDKVLQIIADNDLDGYVVIEQYTTAGKFTDDPRDFLGSKDFYKQMGDKVKDMPKQTGVSVPRGGSERNTDAIRSLDFTADAIRNTLAQQQKIDAYLGSATRQLDRLRQVHMSSGLDRAVADMVKTRDVLNKAFTKAFKNKLTKAHTGLTNIRDELTGAHQYSTRDIPGDYSPELGEAPSGSDPKSIAAWQSAKAAKEGGYKTKTGKPMAQRTVDRHKAALEKGMPVGAEETPSQMSPKELQQWFRQMGDEREFGDLSPDEQRRMMLGVGLPTLPEKIKKYGLRGAFQAQDPEVEPGQPYRVAPASPEESGMGGEMAKERLARSQRMGQQMASGMSPTDYEDLEDASKKQSPELRKQIDQIRKQHYGPGFTGWLRRQIHGPGRLPPGYEIGYEDE